MLKYMLIFFVVGCAGMHTGHDELLTNEIREVEDLIGMYLDYPVVIDNSIHSYGRCEYYISIDYFLPVRVLVNKELIEKNNVSLKLVILHEVGHCTFQLGDVYDHTPRLIDGCTSYIMYGRASTKTHREECWEKHKKLYLRQMFPRKLTP